MDQPLSEDEEKQRVSTLCRLFDCVLSHEDPNSFNGVLFSL